MYEYIGIDISKSTLQIYLGRFDQDIEVENSPKGLKQLYAKVKSFTLKRLKSYGFMNQPEAIALLLSTFALNMISCVISSSPPKAPLLQRRLKIEIKGHSRRPYAL